MNTSTTSFVDGGAASAVVDDSGPELDRASIGLSDPSAAQSGRADVSNDDVNLSDAKPVTALAWLGGAVVNGLMHCACSHHAVHPDLLTLAAGDTPFVTRSWLEQQNGDAG